MNRRDFLKVTVYSTALAAIPLPFIEAEEAKGLLASSKGIELTGTNYAILRIKTSEGNLDFKLKLESASQGKIILPSIEFTTEKAMTIYTAEIHAPSIGVIATDIEFNTNHVRAKDTVSLTNLSIQLSNI